MFGNLLITDRLRWFMVVASRAARAIGNYLEADYTKAETRGIDLLKNGCHPNNWRNMSPIGISMLLAGRAASATASGTARR